MGYNWAIAESNIFTQRFGSMGVSEMRKILFAVYMSGQAGNSNTSDYEVGRSLGLTAKQVKNLKVGANLLLEDDDSTREVVRASLKRALDAQLLEYQKASNRIAVQIDDPVAFNYLASRISQSGVFRNCDSSNGHIAVPISSFDALLEIVSDDVDESALESELAKRYPDFRRDCAHMRGALFAKLSDWLPHATAAATVVADFATIVGSCL